MSRDEHIAALRKVYGSYLPDDVTVTARTWNANETRIAAKFYSLTWAEPFWYCCSLYDDGEPIMDPRFDNGTSFTTYEDEKARNWVLGVVAADDDR